MSKPQFTMDCNKCDEALPAHPCQFNACGHFLCRACAGGPLESSYLHTRGTRCTHCGMDTQCVTLPAKCDLFQFGQAGEALKKKLRISVAQQPVWMHVVPPILTLIGAESVYLSLAFLESGWAKKEALTSMYVQSGAEVKKLSSHFHKLCETEDEADQYSATPSDNPIFFKVLMQQTVIYVQAKTQMMTHYRAMANSPTIPNYDDLLSTVDTLMARYETIFTHPLMHGLYTTLHGELAIMQCLFRTQAAVESCKFKNSIFLLHQTRMLLEEFRNQAPNTSFKKGFNLSTTAVSSAVISWLHRMWIYMTAKVSFYFSEPLRRSEEELGGDFRLLGTQLEPNYPGLIEHFVTRSDAYNVSLVYDSQGNPIQAEGYHCPDPEDKPEKLTGLAAYPCVYAHPHRQGAIEHWPNIVSLIMEHQTFLHAGKHPYHHFDERRQVTYFLAKIEQNMYLAVVYHRKRQRQDKSAVSFVTGVANLLRNQTGFALLRAGSALQRLQQQKV